MNITRQLWSSPTAPFDTALVISPDGILAANYLFGRKIAEGLVPVDQLPVLHGLLAEGGFELVASNDLVVPDVF